MVKNFMLRTRWDREDLRTDFQGTQFLALQNGILWPTIVAAAECPQTKLHESVSQVLASGFITVGVGLKVIGGNLDFRCDITKLAR
jgi:hypothetical protein